MRDVGVMLVLGPRYAFPTPCSCWCIHAVNGRVRRFQPAPLWAPAILSHLPTLTLLTHYLGLGNTHIRKKDLVKISVARHIDQRSNLNTRRIHSKQ